MLQFLYFSFYHFFLLKKKEMYISMVFDTVVWLKINMLILKKIKNKKNIILIYFKIKIILKNN